jgi:F-type H+-transporting ATPase subunit delta
MRANSVARRYARALFEVAKETGDPETWLNQLETVAEATSSASLKEAMRSARIPDAGKVEAILGAFPDLARELKNLIALMVARGRIDILPGVCVAFAGYVDELLGRIGAQVTSARPLGPSELRAIQEHLAKRTGRTVTLETAVDKTLIGGIVMRVGDEVIDASVATRLERLRQRLV